MGRGSGRRQRGGRRGGARSGDRPSLPGESTPCGGKRIDELCELSPFSVFCTLYLGITEEDGWAPPNARRAARRFDLSPEALSEYLHAHRIAEEHLKRARFDLAGARLDIQVAPPGISRTELARTLWEELQADLED